MSKNSDRENKLIVALLNLLGCTDLNVESLDDTSLDAIQNARQVLKDFGVK